MGETKDWYLQFLPQIFLLTVPTLPFLGKYIDKTVLFLVQFLDLLLCFFKLIKDKAKAVSIIIS